MAQFGRIRRLHLGENDHDSLVLTHTHTIKHLNFNGYVVNKTECCIKHCTNENRIEQAETCRRLGRTVRTANWNETYRRQRVIPVATFQDEEGEQEEEEEDVEERARCQDQLPCSHRPPPRAPSQTFSRAMLLQFSNLTTRFTSDTTTTTMDTLVRELQNTDTYMIIVNCERLSDRFS